MITAAIFVYKRSSKLEYATDRVLIRLPAIGPIIKKSALARFSPTLAIMFGSAVPLVDGMKTVG